MLYAMSLRNKITLFVPLATLRAALCALLLVASASCEGGAEGGGAVAATTHPAPKRRPPVRHSGKNSASAPASQRPNGCQLLTAEEVSQVLGVELKQARRAAPGCEWSSPGTLDKATVDLPPINHARQLLRSAREVVPDLGDSAYPSMRAPGVAVLTVIKGEQAFTLSAVLPTNRSFEEKDPVAMTKKLAEIVLTRL